MKSTVLFFCFAIVLPGFRYAGGARILGIFPLQGKSHFNFHTEVMKSLADAGHRVDVVSHFPLSKPHANYTDIISLAGSGMVVLNNMGYEMLATIAGGSLKELTDIAGTEVCRFMEKPEMRNLIENPPNDPKYDLVIVEYFVANCYFAFGRHLNVPLIALSSASIMPLANEELGNPDDPAYIFELNERPISGITFWQRLHNTVITIFSKITLSYYLKEQNALVKKYFGPDMPGVDVLARDISLLIVNTHHVIHGIRPLTPAIVSAAGIHIHDDKNPLPRDLQKWLDESKDGFVYMSFGSMVRMETFPKEFLGEVYAAFEKIAPLRVLLKIAKPEELPAGLPKNVLTRPWLPQIGVLKHKNIKAFISHGGLGGVLESLRYSVPLIGLPLFGDQLTTIAACANREIALKLDYKKLTSEELASAVKKIVYDPKYKKNMIVLSEEFMDRLNSPQETSVFWIEYILKHGADSLRSPAVQLTWWQTELLDVYGFIIGVILLAIYAVKLIVSKILRTIFKTNGPAKSSKKTN
ncbi:UDP-glucosyltransferase 2-like isoform X1 [Athalia rosae]|uniref:UDP-glucosyltransferase 2-like isoform X1 n=1 Tax=Athalia rosae TaxID=37344 RepID=UPI0020348F49|nr:UDP-glucosyltransferase 2-like isoform X1 [Athalia rosae]